VSVSDELSSSAVSDTLVQLEGQIREESESIKGTGTQDEADLTVSGE